MKTFKELRTELVEVTKYQHPLEIGATKKEIKPKVSSGLEFKGSVPTIPREVQKRYVEPQRKISQPELGSMLRREPQKLNIPKPIQSPTKIATPSVSPSSSSVASSSSGIKGGPNNPPMASSSATKTTSGAALPKPSGSSKPIAPIAKSPVAPSKPAAVASKSPITKTIPTGAAAKPAPKKEIVVDIRKETDPNAPGGPGGFVTGYGSSSGRTANIKRGFYDAPGTKTSSGVQSTTQKPMPTQKLPWSK